MLQGRVATHGPLSFLKKQNQNLTTHTHGSPFYIYRSKFLAKLHRSQRLGCGTPDGEEARAAGLWGWAHQAEESDCSSENYHRFQVGNFRVFVKRRMQIIWGMDSQQNSSLAEIFTPNTCSPTALRPSLTVPRPRGRPVRPSFSTSLWSSGVLAPPTRPIPSLGHLSPSLLALQVSQAMFLCLLLQPAPPGT